MSQRSYFLFVLQILILPQVLRYPEQIPRIFHPRGFARWLQIYLLILALDLVTSHFLSYYAQGWEHQRQNITQPEVPRNGQI